MVSEALAAEAERLRLWLLNEAFPLWWEVGADHVGGGWYERIDFDGLPVVLPKRSRVAARQVFCYCEAGRLGWQGPWRRAAAHALSSLREHFIRSDGTVIAALSQAESPVDESFDLYNQAFALLAYAYAHETIDPGGGWKARAVALIGTLERDFGHPLGGFFEDRAGMQPLRSNPHMHLLEAALAWLRVDPEPVWRRSADAIAALCLDRFVDRDTGALREHFGTDWAPLPGRQATSSSRATTTSGRFCSTVGPGLPAVNGRRRWQRLSLLPTATGWIVIATSRSMRLRRRVASTIRSRGCGRRPNVFAPMSPTIGGTAISACSRRSPHFGATSTCRFRGYGMKIKLLTVSSR